MRTRGHNSEIFPPPVPGTSTILGEYINGHEGKWLMRSTTTLLLFAIMVLSGLAGRSSAMQDANPPGSYQQSCTDISVRKGTLHARCKDDKGKVHSAKLSGYDKCSDIANKNGSLTCARGEGGENTAHSQPRGSYTETCRDIRMKGSTLHAICKSYDGHEAPASLRNAASCSDGVGNINGILNCEVNDVLPPGSYLSTCKDIRMKGTTLYASCNDGKDHWLTAEFHAANRCGGDIANQNGALRCVPIKMERR